MFFPGYTSTCPNDYVKWNRVPIVPKGEQKNKRYFQHKKYHIKLSTLFVLKDRLGVKSKKISYPVWCSKHEDATPFQTKVTFKFNDKIHTERFDLFPVPTNVGPTQICTTKESKGIGIE